MKLDKNSCNYLDITRFIGIYLVIFAHFIFTYQYRFLMGWVFSFHMPLFFLVSGILHKGEKCNGQRLRQLCLSLLGCYLLYNCMGAVYLYFSGTTWYVIKNNMFDTILGFNPISIASWFLLSLFWIKLLSLILVSQKKMIIGSLCCIIFILIFDLCVKEPSDYCNIFKLRSAIYAFPYYTLGYLFKKELAQERSLWVNLLILIITLIINIILYSIFDGQSVAEMQYPNIFVAYCMASAGSLALIYASRLVSPFIKFTFIKDISRGTMMIVGLHSFVMVSMFPEVFFGLKGLREILFLSILLLFAFYLIIKLTYNRLPFLYGKCKVK